VNKSRLALLVILVVLIQQAEHFKIDAYVRTLTAGIFFAIYVAVTGLSLPGAAIMTLVAGAIFGLLWGTLIVSFASTLGATLAFLVVALPAARLGSSRFGDKLKAINAGMERTAASTCSPCA
jgi:uncharacterized membrane protein YdjX (TVP38/TMEM64 family)